MALIQSLTEYPRPPHPVGEQEPYVKVPRFVLERIEELTGAELKVLLYVLRRTVGYGECTPKTITRAEFQNGRKRADGTTLEKGTGLSRAAVLSAIKGLVKKHLLYQEQEERAPGCYVNRYAVCAPEGGRDQVNACGEGSRTIRLVGGITWKGQERPTTHLHVCGDAATPDGVEPACQGADIDGDGEWEDPKKSLSLLGKNRGLNSSSLRREVQGGLKKRSPRASAHQSNLIDVASQAESYATLGVPQGPKSGRGDLKSSREEWLKNGPLPTGEARLAEHSSVSLETKARNQKLKTTQASLGHPQGAQLPERERAGHEAPRMPPTAPVVPGRSREEGYPIVTEQGGAQASGVEAIPDRSGSLSDQSAELPCAAPDVAAPALQVAPEQLAAWREDVVEQRRTVAEAQADYERVSAELERCAPGGRTWCNLRRTQRSAQHRLEAEQQKLAQFELLVHLIEQGYSKDEACEAVYVRLIDAASQASASAGDESSGLPQEAPVLPASDVAPEPLPPLGTKAWRSALFTGLLSLFGWDAQHLNQNSRGVANKAAMLLQESGIRPEQLPRLKQLFELAYPKVRHYTPIALANHCTEFAAAL